MSLHKTPYLSTEFYAQYKELYVEWRTTQNMSEEEHLKTVSIFLDCLNQYQPTHLLSNFTNAYYLASPTHQKLLIQKCKGCFAANFLEKVAIIVSTDYMVEMIIEKIVSKLQQIFSFEVEYFFDSQAAIVWLRSLTFETEA
ncbi:MAG: hypothetical protein NZ551_06160 [Microscillaceae bacterium]|nr:hypothetical protein [Microscillaceae bacterium]MDW8460778.1 hypothetical protein [Cytophagales bacterium]